MHLYDGVRHAEHGTMVSGADDDRDSLRPLGKSKRACQVGCASGQLSGQV